MKYTVIPILLMFYIPSVILIDEQLRPRNRMKGRPRVYIQCDV